MSNFTGANENGLLTIMGLLFLSIIAGLILGAFLGPIWNVVPLTICVAVVLFIMITTLVGNWLDNRLDKKEERLIRRICPQCHTERWFRRYGNPQFGHPYSWNCERCYLCIKPSEFKAFEDWLRGSET